MQTCVNALNRAFLISTEEKEKLDNKKYRVNALNRAFLISTEEKEKLDNKKYRVNALNRAFLISTIPGEICTAVPE